MNLHQIGRVGLFVAGSVVGGLALAFVVVLLRPQLLQQRAPAGSAAPATATATATATASGATAATSGPTPVAAGAASQAGATAPLESPHSFASAVRRAAPAVVSVYTLKVVTERVQPTPLEQLFGDGWPPRYRQRVHRALGSGVIVDAAGHVITNQHVIADAETIMVQLADGRVTQAAVVGRDPDTDLAVLRVRLTNLPVMPLGRSDQLQVGDEVLAIGSPLGLSQTVTHGIVSATGRGQLGVATFENFIQTDAAINEGNSGGALVNTSGELIGINTAVLAKNASAAGVEGIGFAIPVNLARGVMQEILDHGRVIRGWIGIVPEDIADEQARQLGLVRGGIVVANLYVASPAVAAGVRPGDLVLAIDGKGVNSAQDTLSRIAAHRPGTRLRLKLLRGPSELDVNVEVGERGGQRTVPAAS
ncbi:MAG: trypsin-like peptidase domain-containing protein [Gammaproteobacteria bacterium]|nr:trypsin-like peptidase domain-containing protein [Gammaproteobacteria bacterium]